MPHNTLYDVIVVGYGPAGITAGIYAARKNLDIALFGELPGGEVRNSGEIENWPGDRQTNGSSLAQKLVDHLKDHTDRIDIRQENVSQITKEDGLFTVRAETGDTVQGKTVIYTTGRHPKRLNVPGEEKFQNRGVSYCATCDAPLFPDKNIAVIGGGNTGAEAVIMLQRIAKKIYLLHKSDTLRADPVLVENFQDDPQVEIIYNTQTQRIEGKTMVSSLTYTDVKTKEERTIDVDGVFVTIGATPNTNPVKDLLTLDAYDSIPADRYGVTEVPGFFAAGDVTDIRDAQIVVAAGQGCSAALSAGDYLSRMSA